MEMLNEIGKRAKIAKYDVQKYTLMDTFFYNIQTKS